MKRPVYVIALIAAWGLTFSAAWAQQQPSPELLKAKELFSTAGIPGDKWIEGERMLPYVVPSSHFNAAMWVRVI
jgi:hypothetical protein